MKTTPRFLLTSFALSLFAIGCGPEHPSVGPGGHDPTAPKPAGVMPAPMPPPPDTMTPMNPPVEQGVSLLVQGHTRTSQIGDSYTVGSATVAEFYALMSGEAATNWKIQLLWICGGNQTEIFSGSPHPITSDLGLQILSSPGSADYLPFTPHGSEQRVGQFDFNDRAGVQLSDGSDPISLHYPEGDGVRIAINAELLGQNRFPADTHFKLWICGAKLVNNVSGKTASVSAPATPYNTSEITIKK